MTRPGYVWPWVRLGWPLTNEQATPGVVPPLRPVEGLTGACRCHDPYVFGHYPPCPLGGSQQTDVREGIWALEREWQAAGVLY